MFGNTKMNLENSSKLVFFMDREGMQTLTSKNASRPAGRSTIGKELVEIAKRYNLIAQQFTNEELKNEKRDSAKVFPRNFGGAAAAVFLFGAGTGLAVATDEWNPLDISDGVKFAESKDKIVLSFFPTWTNNCIGLFILHSATASKTEALSLLKRVANEVACPISDKSWKETEGWRKQKAAMFEKADKQIEGFEENLWKQLV